MTPMTVVGGLVPQLSARAWLILAGDALSAVGGGLTLPFFLVYLHRVREIDIGVAGLILSTIAVAGLAGNPLGGWLADRVGARRTVVAGLIVTAAGTVAISLVHTAAQGFAAAALYGIGNAVLWPAEDALLATAVDVDRRPHVFAVRHTTLNAGFSVGGLLAALVVSLSSPASFVFVYLVDAASFLVFAVLVARLGDVAVTTDDGPAAPRGGYRDVLRDRLFRRLWLLVVLMVVAGYAQYHAAFPLYAFDVGGLSASGLGVAYAANTFTVVAAQLIVFRLLAGHHRTSGVAASAGFVAAAWLMTLLGGSSGSSGSSGSAGPALFVAAMMLFAIGETLLSPTVPAIVNDLAPEELRGRYNGGYTLAWTLGYVLGPAVAGAFLAARQGHLLFVVLIAVLGLAGVAARRLGHRLPREVNLIAAPSPRAPVDADSHEPRPLALAGQEAA